MEEAGSFCGPGAGMVPIASTHIPSFRPSHVITANYKGDWKMQLSSASRKKGGLDLSRQLEVFS